MKKYIFYRFHLLGSIILFLISLFAILGVLAAKESNLMIPILLVILAIFICFLIFYFYVWKPYKEASRYISLFPISYSGKTYEKMQLFYNPETEAALIRLDKQIKESSVFELNKRQAQYQALQNQINPHFLYNTLESIRSEALLADLDSVGEMCEALANFFRYTISNMRDLVTIEDEIKNIQNYFYIQKYRFGDRMHLNVEYDKADKDLIFEYTIPKLTLQPIVENAIIHGIERKIGEGTVTIRLILTEKRVLIEIIDDGVGMDEEALDKINKNIQNRVENSKSSNGIAITNVNNRIKLLFGEAYGIIVYSKPGIGTNVEIALPRTTQRSKELMQEALEDKR